MKLGIMQGRMVPPEGGRFQSFPRARWRDEFALAASAALDTIEWIYDCFGEDVNPIATDAGISELNRLCGAHGITIESVCADWFMDFPLVRVEGEAGRQRWSRLEWLLRQSSRLNINRVVVPFVDGSAIRNSTDFDSVIDGINSLGGLIDSTNVELHLETSLSPQQFSLLLAQIPHPRVKVNYDAGNSASLGYRPSDEFDAYGARVGSVHLKDRVKGAGTVPLGSGDTDFDSLFDCLRAVDYRGDFILQVARGVEGDEVEWAKRNTQTARQWLRRLERA